jgi:hypothetical protein
MNNNSADLKEQWRDFLRQHSDARSVVDGIMDRTGFEEDEVLTYLLEMWADENVLPHDNADLDGRGAAMKGTMR